MRWAGLSSLSQNITGYYIIDADGGFRSLFANMSWIFCVIIENYTFTNLSWIFCVIIQKWYPWRQPVSRSLFANPSWIFCVIIENETFAYSLSLPQGWPTLHAQSSFVKFASSLINTFMALKESFLFSTFVTHYTNENYPVTHDLIINFDSQLYKRNGNYLIAVQTFLVITFNPNCHL